MKNNELTNFNKFIHEIQVRLGWKPGIRQASDADGGSKVYEIPGYDGSITRLLC
jgi:hypothetical protein